MPLILTKSNIIQFVKFLIVGGIGAIINLLVLFSMTEFLNIYYIFSEVIAFFIALTHNYIVNKLWTFKENFSDKSFQKYLQYVIVSLISLCINLSILFILSDLVKLWYIFAEIFAVMISSLINFFGNKFWTFRK